MRADQEKRDRVGILRIDSFETQIPGDAVFHNVSVLPLATQGTERTGLNLQSRLTPI